MLYSEPFTLYLFGFKYFRFPALSTPSVKSSRGTSSWSAVPSKRSTGQQHSIDGVYRHQKNEPNISQSIDWHGLSEWFDPDDHNFNPKVDHLDQDLIQGLPWGPAKVWFTGSVGQTPGGKLACLASCSSSRIICSKVYLARDLISLKPTSMRI